MALSQIVISGNSTFLVRTAPSRFKSSYLIGALVQLVRIHACHAWGHEFESRTHRQLNKVKALGVYPKYWCVSSVG